MSQPTPVDIGALERLQVRIATAGWWNGAPAAAALLDSVITRLRDANVCDEQYDRVCTELALKNRARLAALRHADHLMGRLKRLEKALASVDLQLRATGFYIYADLIQAELRAAQAETSEVNQPTRLEEIAQEIRDLWTSQAGTRENPTDDLWPLLDALCEALSGMPEEEERPT